MKGRLARHGTVLACFFAAGVLFFVANRPAYQGYFSDDDLALLKRALDQMFELDKSAARANMRPVACIAFRHESPLGNARADRLFDRVVCKPKPGVQPLPSEAVDDSGDARPPRSSADYELTVDDADLPAGVTVERWIDWT